MGKLHRLTGYSDEKAYSVAHYLTIIAMPRVNNESINFFNTCQFSDIEKERFVFCSIILNLSATMAIVDSSCRFKAEQITGKIMNAFNHSLETSPNDIPIKDFIVYNPELESVLAKEKIDIHHKTNKHSLFWMIWPDRFSCYYRHVHRIRGIAKRTNVTFKDESLLYDFSRNIDHQTEMLDYFLLNFINKKSSEFTNSNLVFKYLLSNLVALKNYLAF